MEDLMDDINFVLKRIHEQQDYMMKIATCPVRTKERKEELIDSAKFIKDRFQKRFCELQGWDYEEHKKIAQQIMDKLLKDGR